MLRQNCKMVRPSIQTPFRCIIVLVIILISTHFCKGQSGLTGSPQPIVARVGDNIILPCHLKPPLDVASKTLEWTKVDLNPRFVLVWRAGQDVVDFKNPTYKGRTSLFTDNLKHGNISLKLSNVKPGDEGRYRCFIPDRDEDIFVELVVGSFSSPVISLADIDIDIDKSEVVLQCESRDWYPEPEVLWLDSEGSLLSAGPTETVRGSDDLYTVSSRVTVGKKHSNNITCRVQQNHINQTKETLMHIFDDLFKVQPISFSYKIGFILSVVFITLIILFLIFSVWKWGPEKEEKAEYCYNVVKGPFVSKKRIHGEKERRQQAEVNIDILETEKAELEKNLQTEKDNKNMVEEQLKEKEKEMKNLEKQLREEKQRAEDEIKKLHEQLKITTNELKLQLANKEKKIKEMETSQEKLKNKNTELEQELRTEKKNKEMVENQLKEMQTMNKNVEDKISKLEQELMKEKSKKETITTNLEGDISKLSDEKQRAERESETLRVQLRTTKEKEPSTETNK